MTPRAFRYISTSRRTSVSAECAIRGLEDPGEAGVSPNVQTDGSWVFFQSGVRYFLDVSRSDPADDSGGGYDMGTDAMTSWL